MTTQQAKKDAQKRLAEQNIPFSRMTAKTVSFEDLARGSAIFVEVYGVRTSEQAWLKACEGLARPSEGGYILKAR